MSQNAVSVEPHETLYLPMRRRFLREHVTTPEGGRELRIFYGLKEITIDEPELLSFGENLLEQDQFMAGSWPMETEGDQVIGDATGKPEGAMRFSLAGVQLKFSAIGSARHGLTIPADGAGGSWIVKLPSAQFPGVPENEYSICKAWGTTGFVYDKTVITRELKDWNDFLDAAQNEASGKTSLLDDPTELFGEVGGRAVLACDPELRDEVIGLAEARGVRIQDLGTVGGARLLGVELSQLQSAWDGS